MVGAPRTMEYRVRVTDYKPTELNYPVVGKGTTGVPLFVLLVSPD